MHIIQKDVVNSLSLWPTNLGSAAPKDFTEADRVELAAARAAWAQLWRTLQARAKTPEPLTTEAWFDTRFESVKPDSGIAYFKHFNTFQTWLKPFKLSGLRSTQRYLHPPWEAVALAMTRTFCPSLKRKR